MLQATVPSMRNNAPIKSQEGRYNFIVSSISSAADTTNNISRSGLYVPSDHDAKYFSCSGVRMSILTPFDSSLIRATVRSISVGTG